MKIAFYVAKYGTIFDHLINWCSGGMGYSHCELVFGDGESFSSSSRDGGVRFKRIDYTVNPEHWKFVDVPLGLESEAKIRMFCESQVGKPYDYFGAIGTAFPFFRAPEKGNPKSWFCSEIIAYVLKMEGAHIHKPANRISPNSLWMTLLRIWS